MKFRAKIDESKIAMLESGWLDYHETNVDEQGYVTGWYADGFILGDVVEADADNIIFEHWVPVLRETVELVYTEEGLIVFDEEGFNEL